MKIRIVWPKVYVDTNVWILWEHPVTLDSNLFKTPMKAVDQDFNRPLEALRRRLTTEFSGAPIEFDDLGDWNNIKQSNGMYYHPFTKELLSMEE